MSKTKVAIIGSGPAAHTAAIYTSRAELYPALFEGFMSGTAGGQLMSTTEVENFPGFPNGITGPELMSGMRAQSQRLGTTIYTEDVTEVKRLNSNLFKVSSSNRSIEVECVIIATGATAKRLQVPGTRDGEFWQKGVTACAVCDGAMPIFRDKPLFVIGGGDTAAEEALFLTKYASHVYIVHRRGELRASKIMAKRVLSHSKITALWNKELVEVTGSSLVERVRLKDTLTGESQDHAASGVFFAIGHTPNTSFLEGIVQLDESGYIQPKTTQAADMAKTSEPGIFVAGDVSDKVYRQAITAAGAGCKAAMDAEHYLQNLHH